jgi:ParB-like chromosome segregation protein Spo0J
MPDTALTSVQQHALDKFTQLPSWTDARMVPVDQLEFCDWNVNEMNDTEFSELVAEIDETGFDEPIQIIPIPGEDDRYLVPGGEHRARAAIALEMDAVPAVLKITLTEMDEADIQMWSEAPDPRQGRA